MRYTEIKQALIEAEIIDEVSMSPTSLEKFANSPEAEGMLIGVEFEMCVPNANVDDDSGEGEYDYDMDERANDIDDIIRFFREGEMSNLGASGADRLRGEMWDQFLDWQSEQISDNIDTDELNDRIRDRLDSDIDFDDMMELAKEQWQENNPDENPEDKASEDEIHQLALKLNEKTLDDMMEDTDSRQYQRAYDDVRQEMEDEMRDDYDQSDWLRSLGIDFMSEAEREWGLDWPHWTYYSSGGEADVDTVAEDFSEATGFQAKGYSGYHSGSRSDQQQQGYFIIEPDGSIDADEGDAGLEFISPAMPLKDGLAMIKKVKDWASAAGCYTNKSTGLHMNISVPDMSTETLDYVKLALFMGDEYILKQFGRQYNSYCKSAMSKIKDRIRPEDVPAVLGQVKQNLNSLASKIIHSGITEKYTSINTRGQYVEFRGPGGDYLDRDPLDLVNTALRLAMSLRIATNPEAYKQEYAKKLYKLVEQSPDADDSVELFSQYAMGQINKSELAARLQFAQRSRKIEKTKPQVKRLIDEPGVRDQINKFPGVWRDTFNSLRDKSNEELQELQKNFDDLGEYYYFTKEQGQLALALIANELESRSTQGEKKQYWVTRRDGDGGKQMVYANNENEAILLGGKQMGMSRNDSILKLKAELFKREEPSGATVEMSGPIWDSLTSSLQGYLRGLSDPDKTVEKLHAFKDKMANNEYGYNLTNEQLRYVNGLINQELARRQGGTVDGLGTRWRVNSPSGSSVYVDADSPRQAKVKAVELFAREHGINVDANDLEAVESTQGSGAVHAIPQVWRDWVDTMINRSTDDIVEVRRRIDQGEYNSVLTSQQQRDAVIRVIDDELRRRQDQGETGEEQEWSIRDGLGRYVGNINATTQAEALRIYGSVNSVDTRNYTATLTDDNPPHSSMSTTSRELFDSLPEGTRSWLERVGEHHDLELRQALDHIEAGRGIGSGLYSNQVAFVKTAIETELRRRSNNDAVDNDDTTRNPVFDTLPQHWKDFLTNDLSYSADMNLINMLRNLSREDAGRNLTLTDQQLAYIRILLKRQLRANGINPDDETPAEQPADLTSPDDETIDDLMGGGDEEEETPQGVDPEHSEWNIVDTETGDVVSRISGGDIVYAVRSAREQERIRDLPLGRLEPRAANQTNESIDLLRKLAGLV